ncbi:MAG: hypothetical protein QOF01_1369, partial [Thermomicrobiales bacterium]|nr:hypothetical protein [Thermomicrobiales bacterium]
FMQRAAALGLSIPTLQILGAPHILAQDVPNRVRWVSPRANLDVLDDAPFWVAKQMGYFGDIETVMEPGPAAGAERLVDAGQSDMAYPSPGVFTNNLNEGVPLKSIWEMGALDVFDVAVKEDSDITDLKQLEGRSMSIGDASWTAIANPLLAQLGVDVTKVEYVVVGGGAWANALDQGQVDSALSWEGYRALWNSLGLKFRYFIGKEFSKFPANSFVVRPKDLDDPALVDLYTRYLRGWAMGLEFTQANPRAATQLAVDQLPVVAEQFKGKEALAVEWVWQLQQIFRGNWAARQGWGWHDFSAWQLFIDTRKQLGDITKDLKLEEILTNDFVPGGNEFDKEKVRQDAMTVQLRPEFEAVPAPVGTGADGDAATPTA